jgi:hypothetical protein
MRRVIVMLRTCLLAACLAGGASPAAQAQSEYPEWIADRYCKEFANKAACRASLKISELLGETRGEGSNMDADGDGQVDQWASSASAPRLARCVYRHPRRPDWNFDEVCFFTSHTRVSAMLREWRRFGVKNGSGFVLKSVKSQDDTVQYSANEHPARLRTMDGNDCYEVIGTGELFCVLPAGEKALRQADEKAETTDDRSAAESESAGETHGWCLIKKYVGPGAVLVDHGRCHRRLAEHCGVGEASGEYACEQVYDWESNRTTRIAQAETTLFIDEKPVSNRHGGCVSEYETLTTFCFSQTAFNAKEFPTITQKSGEFFTREGHCAWRYPDGNTETGECTLWRECRWSISGCEYEFKWDDGKVTRATTRDFVVGSIDLNSVTHAATSLTVWLGVDPKCATKRENQAEFCFSTESKAAVMP